MIVRFTAFQIDCTVQSLLDSVGSADMILCCGDGVYAFNTLKQLYPALSVYALYTDCVDRGLTVTATLTSDKLCELHQQHQQWISI